MYTLGIVTKAFLGIILTLDSWIYSLISSAYKIFMAIASARILSSDAYTAIANKVYIIIGVGMLFVLAYAIMKAIIDPDQMSKGDMAGGKILKSIAIAVIGLIVTPLIFDLAYMAQGKMLEDDILGKIFFRTEDSVEKINGQDGSSYTFNYDQELHETGGAVAATSVWQAFFYPADGEDPTKIMADPDVVRMNANIAATACAGTLLIGIAGAIGGFFTGGAGWVVAGAAVASCVGAYVADSNADQVEQAIDEEVSLAEAFTMVSSGKTGFAVFQAFLDPIDEGQIKYTWFISTVCGAFVAYAFVSYAIDMGLRAAKLAYYQIIAPIPLILGVLPKNGDRVGKFAKAVFSTFLEVFVRISVVYIVIYIIAHLNELFSTVGALWDSENLTTVESMIAMALLIIGLVLFAKQAPKIISDTFGLNAGGLEGLNIMKKLRDGEVFTAGTIAGSTIRSGVQGAVAGWKRNDGKKLHNKLLGAAGSSIAGAGAGAIRSGVGRARSGKPVGGVREMRDNIDRETRAVADKRKSREEFFEQHPNVFGEGGQIAAKWEDVKSAGYRWAVGDVDMSKHKSDIAFAGNLNAVLDDVRSEAEKKDPTTKALAKEEERLSAPLSRYREGWSEERRNDEIGKRMRADATYGSKEAAYTAAKADVDRKKLEAEAAKEALDNARNSGADAATLAGLESTLRSKEAAHQAALTAFNPISDDFESYRDDIISRVDAVAMMSEEEFTAASIKRQKDLKAVRDKKEAAADAYVIGQMADTNSVVYSKIQDFLNNNQEYMTANASRELVVGFNPDGTEIKVKVGDIISSNFGARAINGEIDLATVTNGRNNTINLTMSDGSDVTYRFEAYTDRNGKGHTRYVDASDPSRVLSEEEFAAELARAADLKASTTIKSASERGKDAKRSIPNSKSYKGDLRAARKEKKDK